MVDIFVGVVVLLPREMMLRYRRRRSSLLSDDGDESFIRRRMSGVDVLVLRLSRVQHKIETMRSE